MVKPNAPSPSSFIFYLKIAEVRRFVDTVMSGQMQALDELPSLKQVYGLMYQALSLFDQQLAEDEDDDEVASISELMHHYGEVPAPVDDSLMTVAVGVDTLPAFRLASGEFSLLFPNQTSYLLSAFVSITSSVLH